MDCVTLKYNILKIIYPKFKYKIKYIYYSNPWNSVEFRGVPWNYVGFPWNYMEFHGVP